jgi:hypothetical protein
MTPRLWRIGLEEGEDALLTAITKVILRRRPRKRAKA